MIDLPLATGWRRTVAYLTDLGILSVGLGVYLAPLFAFQIYLIGPYCKFKNGVSIDPQGLDILHGWLVMDLLVLLSALALCHVYFAAYESKQGATPGKRIFGLSVCNATGGLPTFKQSLIRDVLRYIEMLLIIPLIVKWFLGGERRRLGDQVSKTWVVYSQATEDEFDFHYVTRQEFQYWFEKLKPITVPEDVAVDFLYFAKNDGKLMLANKQMIESRTVQACKYLKNPDARPNEPELFFKVFAEICLQGMGERTKYREVY